MVDSVAVEDGQSERHRERDRVARLGDVLDEVHRELVDVFGTDVVEDARPRERRHVEPEEATEPAVRFADRAATFHDQHQRPHGLDDIPLGHIPMHRSVLLPT